MPLRGRWCLVLLAVSPALLAGCFGVSQNPSYFPHLLPTGDIIRTHAKPPGPSYYTNFDPHAVRLEVRPLVGTNPVRTQLVLIATVYDEKGEPRRNRRVEWMVEGVGNIVEVDESGIFPGRGYKVDNHYAVSYTNYKEHRITRGNINPSDDFVLRPGQSWCVISSAVEGDTHVTVYAPEIADWDKHKVFVTNHWVDAGWTLPPPASDRAGAEHVFTTNIFRHTDRQPLANYRVRYRIVDGPPAVFLPSRTQEAVVVSDLRGNAHVTLAQVRPGLGVNHIAIEIIRPPDPSTPSGSGITIGSGETAMEWLAPAVALTKTGPASAGVGQDIPYTIAVANTGRVETRSMTVRDAVPDGLDFVSSQPPAIQEGRQLTWTLGVLPPGQTHTITAVFRSLRPGPVTNRATVVTEEGLQSQNTATTQITAPQLTVAIAGPAGGVVGVPLTYQITVSNPGSGAAANVVLSAAFDKALEHETKASPVEVRLGTLGPNEFRRVPLTLTPRQEGQARIKVLATADAGLRAEAEQTVLVQKAQLTLTKTGPRLRFVNRPADFEIKVGNPGAVPLANVVVRDQLPAELSFVSASDNGQLVGTEVEWRLAALQPKEEKVLKLSTLCKQIARQAVNVAVATTDSGLRLEAKAAVEIQGIPAYKFQVNPVGDAFVEVGKHIKYEILVTNTGSLAANRVEIKAILPPELKLVNANGPSQNTIKDQTITFAPVDSLKPQQTLTYTIEAEAVKAGDVRFRAELRGQALDREVVKEAPTNVIESNGGK
jgi:uncharacterized repeat protein (TIGR01451 family)